MTLGTMKFALLTYLKESEVSLDLDGPTSIRLINEALQYVYMLAVSNDPSFYTKSASFVSASSVNHASDYWKTLVIEVPTAGDGAARQAGHKEYIYTNGNTWLTGVTNSPLAVVNRTQFTISPASAGVHWYLWQFSDITDETYDLSDFGNVAPAVIPWVFEEMVIVYAAYLAQIRDALTPAISGEEVHKRMGIALETQKKFENLKSPQEIFFRNYQSFQPVGPTPLDK